MVKITKWHHGLKEGNNELSKPDYSTLDNFTYSKERKQLIGSKPITTTLNSFYLGEQHKISSGGENVFFTNNSSNIDWFPAWQGLKDHSIIENQGNQGLIGLTGREYTSDLLSVDFNGPIDPTGATVDYISITQTPTPISVFGVKFHVGENLKDAGLYYRAYIIDGGFSKRAVYEQELDNITALKGDMIEWWFDHPIEAFPTFEFLIELTTDTKDMLGERVIKAVASVLEDKPYIQLKYRTFKDNPIPFANLFVTNVQALTPGKDAVVTRRDSPNNPEVSIVATDSQSLRVEVEWDRAGRYQGTGMVNDYPVVVTSVSDNTIKGYSIVTLQPTDTSLRFCVDSMHIDIPLILEEPPVILDAYLIQDYPGTQTELKAGDVVTMYVEADKEFDKVRMVGGLSNGLLVYTARGTTAQFQFTVTNTNTTLTELAQTITVADVATSAPFETTNKMFHNNLYPSITFNNITYPIGQQALKDSESATVSFTLLNYDSYSVTDPLNQLSINDSVVTRIGGGYNLTNNNYVIQATRNSNGAVSTKGTTVFIAHDSPVVSVVTPSHLRSGGNDGTLAQQHKVSIVANQRVLSPTLDASIGTWVSGWTSLLTEHYRYLEIHDDDPKGTGTFSNLSITNLAGRAVTTGSGLTYSCQGFVSRILPIAPFGWKVLINVAPTVTGNLQASWSFKAGITYTISTVRPQVDKYTIQGGEVRLLDKAATDSSIASTTLIIEEI